MKLIGITTESFYKGEPAAIVAALEAGIDVIHLRKPTATTAQVGSLLQEIPSQWHDRVVIHDHLELTEVYTVLGIHLNSRHPLAPPYYKGQQSRSCHTLQEVANLGEEMAYAFLSPIYTSISKVGYNAAFTHEELTEASRQGIIGDRVVALGGITLDNIAAVQAYGFGGAALLGYLWQDISPRAIQQKVEQLRAITAR